MKRTLDIFITRPIQEHFTYAFVVVLQTHTSFSLVKITSTQTSECTALFGSDG